MSLTCPKCEKENNCFCNNCNKDQNVIILDKENELYQCCFCGFKFDESESLEYSWNKMINYYVENINPLMCLKWISSSIKEKKEIEKEFGIFGYETAFKFHFKKDPQKITKEEFNILLIQVNRETKINEILK